MWFGTESEGVTCVDGSTITTYTRRDGLAHDSVRCIAEDRKGALWFGTWSGGVSRFDGNRFTTFTTAHGLANDHVWALHEDRNGMLWVATSGGVNRFDGSRFARFPIQDGLANDQTRCIAEGADGMLWFGTARGVSRYDGRRFSTFTTQDGLAGSQVNSIVRNNEGTLWIATNAGLSRFDGKAFQNLYGRDGLSSNDLRSVHIDRSESIWAGTVRAGVTRFRPHASPIPVFIEEVTSDRPHGPVEHIELSSSQRFLKLDFHAISFKTRPEAMLFRYRLLGHEDDWRTTHERQVIYRDLPRGEYAFEVQAIDRDLSYSETPARVTIHVHPPYGQIALWSALALALASATGLAGLVVRRNRNLRHSNAALALRTEQLQSSQQESMRNERLATLGRLTATVSHELRNPLGTIRGSAAVIDHRLRGSGNGIERALDRIDRNVVRCERIIEEMLDFSREARLRAEPTALDPWVREVIADQPLSLDIDVRLQLGAGVEVAIDRERIRRALINVFENARQAMADRNDNGTRNMLLVATEVVDDRVRIRMSDTGPGMTPEVLAKIFEPLFTTKNFGVGLGLPIVRQVLRQHGGDVTVESEADHGTTVTFSLPSAPELVEVS